MTKRKSFDELVSGLIPQVRARKQVSDKLLAGEWGDEEVLEAAQAQACELRFGTAGEPDPKADADDAAFRAGQEDLYRTHYGFDQTKVADEVSLQQLLDLSVAQRRLERDLKRSRMPYRERTELLKEMRQLTSDHSALQKLLGIDRASRTAPTAGDQWLTELHANITDGANMTLWMIAQAAQLAAAANNAEELREAMKGSLALEYDAIDPWLYHWDRVHHREPDPELLLLSTADFNPPPDAPLPEGRPPIRKFGDPAPEFRGATPPQ